MKCSCTSPCAQLPPAFGWLTIPVWFEQESTAADQLAKEHHANMHELYFLEGLCGSHPANQVT